MIETETIVNATVTEIVPYGLWLQKDQAKILVQVTDLSWNRYEWPELHNVGDTIRVKLLHFDEKRNEYYGSVKLLHPEFDPGNHSGFYLGAIWKARVYDANDRLVIAELLPGRLDGSLLLDKDSPIPRIDQEIFVRIDEFGESISYFDVKLSLCLDIPDCDIHEAAPHEWEHKEELMSNMILPFLLKTNPDHKYVTLAKKRKQQNDKQ